MDLEIPAALASRLLAKIETDTPLAKQLAEHQICHSRMIVASRLFNGTALNSLFDLCKHEDERVLMFQLLALDNIRNAPEARQIPDLESLVPGMIAYLSRDAIDGWLY